MSQMAEHDNGKAGAFAIVSLLLFGGILLAAAYMGVDWFLSASGIYPHK